MEVRKEERFGLRSQEDIVRTRQIVRTWSVNLGFNLVEQTKIVTAASELARNTVEYGGGGELTLRHLANGARAGLCLEFVDQGPGIADLDLALKDGYTTGGGLGLGLSGSRRLMNEFSIESSPGNGTRVRVVRWK
ncbi:MAG: anti-sigma regulatory factor [Proteobacteria bacterium]|nr:MAG: anti-sigma regulatory factor [Pseudomonadota bacterium]